jgi:magnesium transporter
MADKSDTDSKARGLSTTEQARPATPANETPVSTAPNTPPSMGNSGGSAGPTVSSSELAAAVVVALDDADDEHVKALVGDLRAPDLADVIEQLPPAARVQLIQTLGPSFDFEVLSELEESVRDQVSEALPNETLARAVEQLDTDDAAYVIENLEPADRQEVLAQISTGDRAALERNLEYPEYSAGRLMQSDFVAVAPFWNVGDVIDFMREAEDLPETFTALFVVDPSFKVLGSVDISRLLRSKRHIRIDAIMERDRESVQATASQEVVARQFQRYDLMSAPVVDQNQRLVGVVTVDDVVDVIQDEAEEDIKLMGGVGHELISDSVRQIVPSRFAWLFVNLLTAILASSVIKVFDATIENMVALAVLMPIVASMGGNAGTQTMTVAVRALATQELTSANMMRVVLRETAAGLLNGIAFAIIMGIVVFFWYGQSKLGAVIGGAMIINLLAASLAGIFIPLTLHRYKFDPAVSSTVFVTTVTDVVGFFAFLWLATKLLV